MEITATGSQPEVTVIIPTYREAENLPFLIPRVFESLGRAALHGEILVVDDDSQDGTEYICKQLSKRYPLRLIIRTDERGLATAVIQGMNDALGQVFVVMDGDLSHPPERIPELVASVRLRNADFAIGSRYVRGGHIVGNWGLLRRANSKVAALLARPLVHCSDPMSGFFALKRSTYEHLTGLNPIGYKIGLELLVKGRLHHIEEIPISFSQRTLGCSKLTLTEQIKYIRHIVRLYLFKLGLT